MGELGWAGGGQGGMMFVYVNIYIYILESSGRASRGLDSSWPQPNVKYLLDQRNFRMHIYFLHVDRQISTHDTCGKCVGNSVVFRLLFHYIP